MNNNDLALLEENLKFYHDPYRWVLWAFDWGYGDLEGFDGPDEWQKDYLITLGEQITKNAFNGKDAVQPVRMAIASGHGVGKAQVLDCEVFSPTGKVIWGNLKPGDFLFDREGNPTQITACKNYSQIPIYRVTFDDKSFCDVSSGHLWNVRGRQERRNLETWRTMETIEILNLGVKRPNGISQARQWEIPVQGAAQFDKQETALNPYLLGVWLGDGNKNQPRYSKPYLEVKSKIENFGYTVHSNGDSNYIQNIKHLMSDDVFTRGSHERYVPDNYKYNSIENRRLLFEGLCDTDGEVNHTGTIGYSTTSKQLADDMLWLARSLGCKATIQPAVKKGFYKKDGVKVECRDCYRLTINCPFNPFSIKHKKERYKPSEKRYLTRWIDSIEYIGLKDAMCVEVDNKEGLYQINDFIITHNSAITSWLIMFLMSTRPYCKGSVTAGTAEQLKTKTWAELGKWKSRCITGHWFELTSKSIYYKQSSDEKPWRCDAQTCREENSDSFAGQHVVNSTSFYLFDEASTVPDKIWEVAEGGLTDGEPMFFAFGNPVRNTGMFAELFKRYSHRWITKQIDSRTAKFPNKKLIAEWKEDHGEDSDFFRVRVRGMFPRAGDMQFFGSDIVYESMKRSPGRYLGNDPLICGFDVSRGGPDDCVIVFRRGFDAKSEKVYRIPGEKSRDSMVVVSKLTMVLDRHKPDVVFIDASGIGGPIGDRLKQLGYHVIMVNFGGRADEEKKYSNKTTEMAVRAREWMLAGGSIWDDPQIERELTCREYWHNKKDQLVLESKDEVKYRLGYSPDWADAFYLTFAFKVPPRQVDRGLLDTAPQSRNSVNKIDYDPLEKI